MAIFHLTAKTASRAGGQSAAAHFEYIARRGKYSNRERDRLVFAHSGNMPEWAKSEPQSYWSAADQHERANGRLFKTIEFALPVELNDAEKKNLALAFAKQVTETKDGKLPFSLAIHEGRGHNPHCHLMVSERVMDVHQRSAEVWFKRAATCKTLAEEGGAKKTELLKPKEWLLHIRELWSRLANQTLTKCKIAARIDHRSNEERGIRAAPGQHAGPHGFKKRRPRQITETAHQKRGRQLEIVRTERELSELKHSIFDVSRQASKAKLSAQKSVAPVRTAPVPNTESYTPNF
jgi:hypothetical protein